MSCLSISEASKVFIASVENAWIGRGIKRIAEVYLHLSFRVSRDLAPMFRGKVEAQAIDLSQASRVAKDGKKDAVANAMRRVGRTFSVAAQGME
jgi:hypothetical protein